MNGNVPSLFVPVLSYHVVPTALCRLGRKYVSPELA